MSKNFLKAAAVYLGLVVLCFIYTLFSWLGGERALGNTATFFGQVLGMPLLLMALGGIIWAGVVVHEKSQAGIRWAVAVKWVAIVLAVVTSAVIVIGMALQMIAAGNAFGWVMIAGPILYAFALLANRLWGWRI